jgi:hypothetical protein
MWWNHEIDSRELASADSDDRSFDVRRASLAACARTRRSSSRERAISYIVHG